MEGKFLYGSNDPLTGDLMAVASRRRNAETRERNLIRKARNEKRPWTWIADVLELPSATAAQRRWQYLANREVGITDEEPIG